MAAASSSVSFQGPHDEEVLARTLAGQIQAVHGSKSVLLAMLPYSDNRLVASGVLMRQHGIAPMCGELDGGLRVKGVNQNYLSINRIKDIWHSIFYYSKGKNSLIDMAKFSAPEPLFQKHLEGLETRYPNDGNWDKDICGLLQLKQWAPKEFEVLAGKYRERIRILEERIMRKDHREQLILAALKIDQEDVQRAMKSEEEWQVLKKEFELGENFTLEAFSTQSVDATIFTIPDTYFSPGTFAGVYPHIIFDILKLKAKGVHLDAPLEGFAAIPEQVVTQEIAKRIQANADEEYVERLKLYQDLFTKPAKVEFTKEDKALMEEQFPILLATTKIAPLTDYTMASGVELSERGMDLLFIPQDKMHWMAHIEKRFPGVRVLDLALADKIQMYAKKV